MKKALKIFSVVLISLVLTFFVLGLLFIESEPKVSTFADHQVDSADSVNLLLNRLKKVTQRRFMQQKVTFTRPQVNSLLGFVQRAMPEFSGDFTSNTMRASIQFSYQVPILNRYINLRADLLTATGIVLENVTIGEVDISGEFALWLMTNVVNQHTDSDIGDDALNLVEYVETQSDGLTITLSPIHDFLMRLNEIQNGLGGADDEELKQRVTHYLAFLSQLDIPQNRPGLSLADFFQPLFQHAKLRNQLSSAALENEAAILAVAIYTGHHRLANFVGDVQPFEDRVVLPKYRPMLAQRSDLTQHFVISAAIKILSKQGVSAAIGEFKELMDRAPGGSGFSFADLAADLAGIEFAVVAIDPRYAEQVQMLLAQGNDENVFFPSIKDLPEGLTKEEFTRRYQTVESEMYLLKLDEINLRINQLPLVKIKQ